MRGNVNWSDDIYPPTNKLRDNAQLRPQVRERSSSERRLFMANASSGESFGEKHTRLKECYDFFADFWASTPHPVGQMVLVVGWSIAVAVMNDSRIWGIGLELDENAGRTMTTIIAFLIVFRTNQSYNRWWEGRILWGKMHWCCVELSQLAAGWIKDDRLARRIMHFAITYAYTVKQHLRREPLLAEDLIGLVEPTEVRRMNRQPSAITPYYCTDVIRQCIKKGLTEHPQTHGVQAVARGIDIPVAQLSSQFADMARVRNTPQPDVFRVMLHMFTIIYLLLLPIISYDAMGYWVIPEVLLTSYLMLGLQLAAKYLEDPFGYDLSDLELDLYVQNIKKQCEAAFFLGEKSDVDLTLPDGGATREVGKINEESKHGDHNRSSSSSSQGKQLEGDVVNANDKLQNSALPDSSATSLSDAAMPPTSKAPSDDSLAADPLPPSPSSIAADRSTRSIVGAAAAQGPEDTLAPQHEVAGGGEVGGSSIEDRSNPPRGRQNNKGNVSSRGRVAGGDFSGARSTGRSSPRVPHPKDGNSGSKTAQPNVLAFPHHSPDDVVPRRRATTRPGRGQSPSMRDAESTSVSPLCIQLQNFIVQDANSGGTADVV